MTSGRYCGLDRQRNRAVGLAIIEILLCQDPRALRIGAWSEEELRGVIGKRQGMPSQERLVALPCARDLTPAAHRIAAPDVQFSKQCERLWFATRGDDPLQ